MDTVYIVLNTIFTYSDHSLLPPLSVPPLLYLPPLPLPPLLYYLLQVPLSELPNLLSLPENLESLIRYSPSCTLAGIPVLLVSNN